MCLPLLPPSPLANSWTPMAAPSTDMLRLLKLFSWPGAEPRTLGLPTPCSSASLPHIGNEATFNHLPRRILDITLGASPVLPIPVTSFLNLDHVLPFLFLPFLLWFLLYQLSPWPLLSPYCCSVTVVSDSLPPHGLQHARLPHPSLSPGVCSTDVHWVRDAF